jgi:hypothetical protein
MSIGTLPQDFGPALSRVRTDIARLQPNRGTKEWKNMLGGIAEILHNLDERLKRVEQRVEQKAANEYAGTEAKPQELKGITPHQFRPTARPRSEKTEAPKP